MTEAIAALVALPKCNHSAAEEGPGGRGPLGTSVILMSSKVGADGTCKQGGTGRMSPLMRVRVY
ncbi:hypothetical protein PtA15_6A383 [Puccinia triticina]|uniref:Uncharacterized protein n=1 Tax=Puccinia triticina TaxID=208348 RepID=A0ABY7CKJ9_9BASI|nr:uncharacterized protein PtA15_6A383 [Puccinia triticina]WAQ85754.1 hypothetical protein PtA15_6A383 [Puccinia triticina]